ncbi:right-handed parallel beta-helix repeat-containing protein [Ulvibacterium sp.]|uniref:right-handed parallel beta-helix repeat-containing protein n=1 Tax=Ulvibacterium sp. TaxID=2665914 RepID=UPI003BA8D337
MIQTSTFFFIGKTFKTSIIAILALLLVSCQQDIQVENIHISPSGSDDNKGTSTSPFKTIQRGIEEVTMHINENNAHITVYLKGGIYELDEPIRVESKNFPIGDYSVSFRALNNEKPVISGGKVLGEWTKVSDTKIWKTTSNGVRGTREIYINGSRATLAKGEEVKVMAWDKTDVPDIKKINFLKSYPTYQGNLPVYEGYLLKGKFEQMVNWQNPGDIEAVYLQGWTYVVCPVESLIKNDQGVYMKMDMPCFKDAQIKGGLHVEDPSYFQNSIELLDEPGEWHLDSQKEEIFYMPKDSENIELSETVLPIVENLVVLKGTLKRPLKNILFDGISFEYASFFGPGVHGFAEVQATLTKKSEEDANMHGYYEKMKASIELQHTNGITFQNCDFTKLGGSGIDLDDGARNTLVQGCHFYDIGGNAIQIGGFDITDAHPQDDRNIVMNTIIDNNLIHNIGTIYKGSIGILGGYAQNTQITHNEIYDIAYSGISLGWGWGFWDKGGKNPKNLDTHPDSYPIFNKNTISSHHLIGWNHIFNVMTRLTDGAGIYTISMMENSKIIGNHVHDNPPNLDYEQSEDMIAKHTHGWPGGIYLDEGSGGIEVTGNLVYNVVQPYFYNNLLNNEFPWYERENTNRIHNNYFGHMPFNSDELRYLKEHNQLNINVDSIQQHASIIEKAGRKNKRFDNRINDQETVLKNGN